MLAKKWIILFVLFVFPLVGLSQGPKRNLLKNWMYRDRLLDEFMRMGEVDPDNFSLNLNSCLNSGNGHQLWSGLSIPANSIKYGDKWDIHFTDGSMYLGWYMSVLATEYQLQVVQSLKDGNGRRPDSTLLELYMAMEAFDRLDRVAESSRWWGSGKCYEPNGYFIKHDLLSSEHMALKNSSNPLYLETFKQMNPPGPINPVTGQPEWPAKIPFYNGRHIATTDNDDNDNGAELSKDQIVDVFMGLAFVKRFLPDENIWLPRTPRYPNGRWYNFHDRAQEFTRRIMDYLVANHYRIVDPETGVQVELGNDLYTFAYGVLTAGQWIADEDVNTWATFRTDTAPLLMWNAYQYVLNGAFGTQALRDELVNQFLGPKPPGFFASIGYGVRKAIIIATLIAIEEATWPLIVTGELLRDDNRSMIGILAAVGNSWYLFPPIKFGAFQVKNLNTTATSLSLYTLSTKQELFPLIRQALHGGANPAIPSSTYIEHLDSAPCNGPRFGASGDDTNAPFGWRARNRYFYPSQAEYGEEDSKGQYNGLDYMLLDNLYRIVMGTNGYNSRYDNYLYNNLHVDFPTNDGSGTASNPAFQFGYRYFSYDGKINPGAHVTFVADKDATIPTASQIVFQPGTVIAGADFHAHIEVMDCDYFGWLNKFSEETVINENPIDFAEIARNEAELDSLGRTFVEKTGISDEIQNQIASGNITPEIQKLIDKFIDGAQQDYLEISINPNPVKSICSLSISTGISQKFDIHIADVNGHIVYKREDINVSLLGKETLSIDLENLADGPYVCKVIGENGLQRLHKLIKISGSN